MAILLFQAGGTLFGTLCSAWYRARGSTPDLLSGIAGRVGTSLIRTTLWTGVRPQHLLAEAQVQDGARYLYITSGDGSYETVDLDMVNLDERIMVCLGWVGNQLRALLSEITWVILR